MLLDSILNGLQLRRPLRRANRGRAGRRPRFEVLDERCLLSLTTPVDYSVGTTPQAVVAADFNNDGRLDLATANASSSNVSVLLGNANGTFQSAQTFTTGEGPKSIAVGDFNGDGALDIATANASDVSVLTGNGNGTFGSPSSISIGTSPESVAVGDFNGDGKLDLAATSNVYYPGDGWYYYGHYEGQAN